MTSHAIGVDVGGTKMLGVVVDPDQPGQILRSARCPTPRGPDALLGALADIVDELQPDATAPVGVGIPGLVDRHGTFRYGPNLPDVVDVELAVTLDRRLGRRVSVDNDATCAALAEFRAGAGAGVGNGLMLTLGTGIGAGLVLDGAIRRGANGFAGEPGHMLVDPTGPQCPCGRRGCWERYASGSGLASLARSAARTDGAEQILELAGGEPDAVRGEHVVAAARTGDGSAGRILDEFAWWIAAGVANLVDLLDPGLVVLGGGVMEAADVILPRVLGVLGDQVLASGHRPEIGVVSARFGERAGAIGAALLPSDALI